MTKPEIIKYSIIAVLVIAVIVLLVSLFTKKRSDDNYKDVIKAKDETILAIQRERDAYVLMKYEISKGIEEHKKQDSVLAKLYLSNQQIHKSFEKELKNIPINISRIANNDDSISAAFERFN